MAANPLAQMNVSKTRHDLLNARHLPGVFYTSEEIYRQEIETIFMKDWICVGRVEQFANPGDYRAIRIADEPILIVRDREGSLRALANVCQHRGVEVIQGQGNTGKFVCPYHAWSYGLDGKLAGAPFSDKVESFDWKSCALPSLRLETWGGYIFINFDANCPGLEDFLAEDRVQEVAGFLRAEDTRLADEYVFEIGCNWKFVPENLMDMYHVGVIHAASFGKGFPVEHFPFQLTKYGYHAEYQSLTMAPDGEWMFGKPMPWLADKHERFAFTVFIRPSFNMFARPDMLQPWFCHPLGPTKTRVTVLTQYPDEWFEQPAFDQKNQVIKDFIRLVAGEDKEMMLSLQNGVGSRNFNPGPTLGPEKAIHHLLNSYLDRMFGSATSPRS